MPHGSNSGKKSLITCPFKHNMPSEILSDGIVKTYFLSFLSFLSLFETNFFAASPKDFCHCSGDLTKSKAFRNWSSLAGLGIRLEDKSSSFFFYLFLLQRAYPHLFQAARQGFHCSHPRRPKDCRCVRPNPPRGFQKCVPYLYFDIGNNPCA